MTQFGDEKTSRILFLELSQIKINKNDKIKDFYQIFITLLNQILDNPVEYVHIEFYIVGLPPPVAMFVNWEEKKTLAKNFIEAINLDTYLASISSHQGNEESKASSLDKNPNKG